MTQVNRLVVAGALTLLAGMLSSNLAQADNYIIDCDASTAQVRYVESMSGPDGYIHGWMNIEEAPGCGWRVSVSSDYDCQSNGVGCGVALLAEAGNPNLTPGNCRTPVGARGCVSPWLWAPSVRGAASVHTIYGDLRAGPSDVIAPR